MAGALKKTTGLTGLAVARDPHKTLAVVYQKILRVLQKMPETAVYRQSTQVNSTKEISIHRKFVYIAISGCLFKVTRTINFSEMFGLSSGRLF